MRRKFFRSAGLFLIALTGIVWVMQPTEITAQQPACPQGAQQALCQFLLPQDSIPSLLDQLDVAGFTEPSWLKKKNTASRTVSYSVASRGVVTASLDEFKQMAQETFDSPQGWRRLGVEFRQVASGGDFTLYLAAADQMTSFSAEGCDSTYSCQVGGDVIINQDRWLGATPSWNEAGGSLRNYRHMVVNHETGHWLGHGHEHCPAGGQPAPVMQQQSINLQGCTFNPWPLESELHASRLGI